MPKYQRVLPKIPKYQIRVGSEETREKDATEGTCSFGSWEVRTKENCHINENWYIHIWFLF